MQKIEKLFGQKLKLINLGIEIFADDLKRQGVETLHVDWRPPAMGDKNLLKILDEIRKK
jgi:hypothetical protein